MLQQRAARCARKLARVERHRRRQVRQADDRHAVALDDSRRARSARSCRRPRPRGRRSPSRGASARPRSPGSAAARAGPGIERRRDHDVVSPGCAPSSSSCCCCLLLRGELAARSRRRSPRRRRRARGTSRRGSRPAPARRAARRSPRRLRRGAAQSRSPAGPRRPRRGRAPSPGRPFPPRSSASGRSAAAAPRRSAPPCSRETVACDESASIDCARVMRGIDSIANACTPRSRQAARCRPGRSAARGTRSAPARSRSRRASSAVGFAHLDDASASHDRSRERRAGLAIRLVGNDAAAPAPGSTTTSKPPRDQLADGFRDERHSALARLELPRDADSHGAILRTPDAARDPLHRALRALVPVRDRLSRVRRPLAPRRDRAHRRGVYASQGHLSITAVIVVAAVAAIIGDNIGYWLGREVGRPLLYRYGRSRRYADRGDTAGGALLRASTAARPSSSRASSAALRVTGAWMAGITRMTWWRFLFWNAAGGIVWAVASGCSRTTPARRPPTRSRATASTPHRRRRRDRRCHRVRARRGGGASWSRRETRGRCSAHCALAAGSATAAAPRARVRARLRDRLREQGVGRGARQPVRADVQHVRTAATRRLSRYAASRIRACRTTSRSCPARPAGSRSDCTDCLVSAPASRTRSRHRARTWKTYAEGLPHAGFLGAFSGHYAKKHNAFRLLPCIVDDRPGACAGSSRSASWPQISRAGRCRTSRSSSRTCATRCTTARSRPATRGCASVAPLLRCRSTVVFVTFDEGSSNTRGGGHIGDPRPGHRRPPRLAFHRVTATTGYCGRSSTRGAAAPRRSARATPITGIWR